MHTCIYYMYELVYLLYMYLCMYKALRPMGILTKSSLLTSWPFYYLCFLVCLLNNNSRCQQKIDDHNIIFLMSNVRSQLQYNLVFWVLINTG